MDKDATTYDYQARAREFAVGEYAHPIGAGPLDIGRISEVFPGIGMVQVEFPYGSRRYPVEDIEKIHPSNSPVIPTSTENVPGGVDVPSVSAGRPSTVTPEGSSETESGKETTGQGSNTTGPDNAPSATRTARVKLTASERQAMADRVLEAHIKKALYWHSADRNYRVNKVEFESGNYACPKCKEGPMRKAIYKMRGGQRHRLYICPSCTFVIKQDNIHSDHCDAKLAGDRSKKVQEILKGFPRDSKKGRGESAKLMLTGDVAKALGKKDYTSVVIKDLSDAQLAKLHHAVMGGR